MRVIYQVDTLEIVDIQVDDNSITSFASGFCAIQADPDSMVRLAIALNLNVKQIIDFAEVRDTQINMSTTLQQVLKDRVKGQEILNRFLSENKALPLTPEEDLAMLETFSPIKAMLEVGGIRTALQLLQQIPDTEVGAFPTARKQTYIDEMTNYLNA